MLLTMADLPLPRGPARRRRARPGRHAAGAICAAALVASGWLVLPPPAAADPLEARLWVDTAGQPTPLAQQALALLADAASHGLDARDYGLPVLQQQAGAADAATLQAALLRYLRHLHEGRALAPARPAGLRREPFDAVARRLRGTAAWLAIRPGARPGLHCRCPRKRACACSPPVRPGRVCPCWPPD
jgi:hypothetical protein